MRSFIVLAMALPAVCRAELVDRVAISIGARIVTDSEIELRIRLTAFENGETADLSLARRREATERLVDQKLVEREMDVGRYPRLAADARADLIGNYARTVLHADLDALRTALARAGLTPAELEEDLARQSDLLTFLNLRFRPAVQISEKDVRDYFDRKIRPSDPEGKIELNQVRAGIEREIANQRADVELEQWLRAERKRTRIRYLETELAP